MALSVNWTNDQRTTFSSKWSCGAFNLAPAIYALPNINYIYHPATWYWANHRHANIRILCELLLILQLIALTQIGRCIQNSTLRHRRVGQILFKVREPFEITDSHTTRISGRMQTAQQLLRGAGAKSKISKSGTCCANFYKDKTCVQPRRKA